MLCFAGWMAPQWCPSGYVELLHQELCSLASRLQSQHQQQQHQQHQQQHMDSIWRDLAADWQQLRDER